MSRAVEENPVFTACSSIVPVLDLQSNFFFVYKMSWLSLTVALEFCGCFCNICGFVEGVVVDYKNVVVGQENCGVPF